MLLSCPEIGREGPSLTADYFFSNPANHFCIVTNPVPIKKATYKLIGSPILVENIAFHPKYGVRIQTEKHVELAHL